MNDLELDIDTRGAILDQYRRGELTRDQADAKARRLGFYSMELRPDPTKFDPLSSPLWTLPMTLAWIIYRAPDAVRDLMEDYRARCLFWQPRRFWPQDSDAAVEFDLLPPKRLTLYQVVKISEQKDASSLVRTGRDACDELWDALKAGHVAADGVKRGEWVHTPISGSSWESLTWRWPQFSSINDDAAYDSDDKPRYSDVRVRRASVMDLWPPVRKEPDLVHLFKEASRKNGAPIRGKDALEIARSVGVTGPREKIRDAWHASGGSRKSGPKGPRK